jgi:hypothetical protein
MATDWYNMTVHEKLDALRRDMAGIHAVLNALSSDVDQTWDAMRETRSGLDKITKDVATLKSLWPYTKKYSQTG